MTKILTEQWRDGKLPRGHYYCKLYYNDFKPRIQECVKSRYDSKSCIPMSCGCEGEEVLAPVPSYEELQELKEQLQEANAIIKDMRPFIQASISRQTFTRILNYENKWGVK